MLNWYVVSFSTDKLLKIFQTTSALRSTLLRIIPTKHNEVRYLLPGQIIFLLGMYHLETMRSALGKSSNLPSYFVNDSINKHSTLSSCMVAIVDQVSQCTFCH